MLHTHAYMMTCIIRSHTGLLAHMRSYVVHMISYDYSAVISWMIWYDAIWYIMTCVCVTRHAARGCSIFFFSALLSGGGHRKRTTNGRMWTWIWTESMVHATLRKSYTLIRLSFNVIQCYMMSYMTPQYDDYVWLLMIYICSGMMRNDIKWCINTYDEYMICLMYDIAWILNESYGIWGAYATHLNDVYDIVWVLNDTLAIWWVYAT